MSSALICAPPLIAALTWMRVPVVDAAVTSCSLVVHVRVLRDHRRVRPAHVETIRQRAEVVRIAGRAGGQTAGRVRHPPLPPLPPLPPPVVIIIGSPEPVGSLPLPPGEVVAPGSLLPPLPPEPLPPELPAFEGEDEGEDEPEPLEPLV